MTRPTRDGPSLDLDSLRTVTATAVVDTWSGGPGAPAGRAQSAGDRLPPDGRLVWIPPEGEPRELVRSSLRRLATSTDPEGRRCPACGGARSAETVVREHEVCGYVDFGGFLLGAGSGAVGCPKCDRPATEPGARGKSSDADLEDAVAAVHERAVDGAEPNDAESAAGDDGSDAATDERGRPETGGEPGATRAEADGAGSEIDGARIVPERDVAGAEQVEGADGVAGVGDVEAAAGVEGAADVETAADVEGAADVEATADGEAARDVEDTGRDREVRGHSDVDDRFPRVSTVYSCLGCGRILDRPLGAPGDE